MSFSGNCLSKRQAGKVLAKSLAPPLHCIVLNWAKLRCTYYPKPQHTTSFLLTLVILFPSTLNYLIQHYIKLQYIVQVCADLHYILLHFSTLHHNALPLYYLPWRFSFLRLTPPSSWRSSGSTRPRTSWWTCHQAWGHPRLKSTRNKQVLRLCFLDSMWIPQ